MAEPYHIRKYPSRRLYDVGAKRFLTTADIDELIRKGHRIKVTDTDGRDSTRSVLLQILIEREEGREPLLSDDVLHEMVRAYGNAMHGPFGRLIEQATATMREQRLAWQKAFPQALQRATQGVVNELIDQQAVWWKNVEKQWAGSDVKVEKATPPRRSRARTGRPKS